MLAPRRVPYRSLHDLGRLHDQLYPSAPSASASTSTAPPPPPPPDAAAVLALYANHSPASIPVALTLTHALTSSLALPPSHAQRLALAAALTRLVNSLVDPLQQGLYARPVALLAAELGLPGWLVELRHAATHDELPSLALLRDGARDALAYLGRVYWTPTLNPPQAVDSASAWAAHEAVLPALLTAYKKLAKAQARDASLFPGPLKAALQECRAWVAAPGDEARALDVLVERLVASEGGMLIPLAKKKRPTFPLPSPHPPAPLLATYAPLLSALSRAHPALPARLARALAISLHAPAAAPGAPESEGRQSKSERDTRCAWLVWTVEVLLPSASGTSAAAPAGQSKPDVLSTLAKAAFGEGREALRAVLGVLAARDPEGVGRGLGGVLRVLGVEVPQNIPPPTFPLPSSSTAAPARAAPSAPSGPADEDAECAGGAWARVPAAEWTCRPMGVRVGEALG